MGTLPSHRAPCIGIWGYFSILEDADDDDDDQKGDDDNEILIVTEAAESCYTKVSAIVDSGAVEHVRAIFHG